jgi:hypothetical protein
MRLLPLTLCAALVGAAEDVTIGQWNGMLVVTAPSGGGLDALGGRAAQRITLDVREVELTDVVEQLRRMTGLNMVVAPALVAQPPQITLQVRDMALGNVLHWLERVAAIHVGYLHGAVVFADQPIAGASVTRLYDVRDLGLVRHDMPGPDLAIPTRSGGGAILPPGPDPEDTSGYDPDALAELIKRFVSTK